MKPSQTPRGQQWLSNFLPEDIETATLLLDSIHVVSQATIRIGLQRRLEGLLHEGEIPSPTMLLPALSIEDLPPLQSNQKAHVAYVTFSLAAPISSTPGSEGVLGNLVRDISWSDLGHRGAVIPPAPTAKELKDSKIRSIVILSDYSGSGNQVLNFAKTLTRNATLRSWRSYGLLRIHVLIFAASTIAIGRLNRAKFIDGTWIVEPAATMTGAPWTTEQRSAIEGLCIRYAHPELEDVALGYKRSGGLFATDASVPNNLPAVLRQTGQGWRPFFDERTVPSDVASIIAGYEPNFELSEIVTRAGQTRLASQLPRRVFRNVSRRMLTLLALLANRESDTPELTVKTGWPLAEVESLLMSLASLGFIDEQGHVTNSGRKELNAGKRAPRQVTAKLQGSDAPYYPWSMR